MTLNWARLDRQFDAVRLFEELDGVRSASPLAAGYPGEAHRAWTSETLFDGLVDGAVHSDRFGYLHQVLQELGFPVALVRLMGLGPGGLIREHRDAFLGRDAAVVRLHLPLNTVEGARLVIDGEGCEWNPGEVWYGDFSKPHWGANEGDEVRWHIVIDAPVTPQLLALLPDKFSQVAAGSLDLRDDFAFRFVLPSGLDVPGYGLLDREMDGRVVSLGPALLLMLEGQPFLRLVPDGASRLNVIGLPIPATLDLGRDTSGNIRSAALNFGDAVLALGVNPPGAAADIPMAEAYRANVPSLE